MERNKQKLFIIVGILILSIGMTFSYFVAKTLQSGIGSKTAVTTANINGANLKVEGTLEFNDTDVYPGHTSISAIKVTATGDNVLIPYNLVWNGTNEISGLNYKVYKTGTNISVTSNCEKKTKLESGVQQYSEECSITNLDKLGTEVSTGSIKKADTKVVLAKDEFITALTSGAEAYYYVLLEYPNLDINQNDDKNATFDGEVTIEESNKQPDINILATYVKQDNGSYKEQDDIPTSGYQVNTEKSTCSNGATPTGVTPNITVNNLSKTGTSCYLYFDKELQGSKRIISLFKNNLKEGTPDFTVIATGAENEANNGIYTTEDPMYGGISYYWRGVTTTNYVIFANMCWRIVRINGDGTIRLIYNGAIQTGDVCKGNGSWEGSLALTNKYNNSYNNSSYAGWTYTLGQQRPENNLTATESNIKVETESWYNSYIGSNSSYASHISNGKFCNDRRTQNDETWRSNGSNQNYAPYERVTSTKRPSLDCNSADIYTLKVGAITTDEVQFAGASWTTNNKSYYLYNGQWYWTMSPSHWESGFNSAQMFLVSDTGYIGSGNVHQSHGIRPVINLKADTQFNAGSDGTQDNPYIVQ